MYDTAIFLVADTNTAAGIQTPLRRFGSTLDPFPSPRLFAFKTTPFLDDTVSHLSQPYPCLVFYTTTRAEGSRVVNLLTGDSLRFPNHAVDKCIDRFRTHLPSEEETLALLAPETGLLDQLLLKHYNECRGLLETTYTHAHTQITKEVGVAQFWRRLALDAGKAAQELAKRYHQLKLKHGSKKQSHK